MILYDLIKEGKNKKIRKTDPGYYYQHKSYIYNQNIIGVKLQITSIDLKA